MTPDLMEEGARIREARAARPAPTGKTESGGRKAGFSRIATPGEVDITHGRILYLEDVSVSFDGFKAINKLSLDIAPGELRCIIGPNGAGKTTMMDIITGKTRPDSGTVFFGSTIDLLRHNEPQIAQLGIGRKFQKPTVFEQLSVFENLELALKTHKGVAASMRFRLDSAQQDRLAEVLQTIHLTEGVSRQAGNAFAAAAIVSASESSPLDQAPRWNVMAPGGKARAFNPAHAARSRFIATRRTRASRPRSSRGPSSTGSPRRARSSGPSTGRRRRRAFRASAFP